MSLWEEPFLENLDAETSARIKGHQLQMESFSFFFVLCLGQKLYGLTDNLSKTLQKKKMSAISEQRLAFVHRNLGKMRSSLYFELFYQSISKKAQSVLS